MKLGKNISITFIWTIGYIISIGFHFAMIYLLLSVLYCVIFKWQVIVDYYNYGWSLGEDYFDKKKKKEENQYIDIRELK